MRMRTGILGGVFCGWLLVSACSVGMKQEGALPGLAVAIEHEGGQTVVDLTTLTTTTLDQQKWVRLSEVFAAANLNLVAETYTFYIKSSGGYRPETVAECSGLLPLDGTKASQGYISPLTRTLKWDTALQFPDCLSVEDAMTFIIDDKAVR